MKVNDKDKLRGLSKQELLENLNSKRKEILELSFKKIGQQLTNFMKIKETRRDIARLLTIIKQKES
jgi:large subunit ribosomal protein L29